MPISDWEDMMPQVVTYEAPASRNEYGAITFAAAVSYRARVVYKQTRIVNRINGQDSIATGQVWLAGAIRPSIDARITLPDGSTPIILNWEMFPDEEGDHHTKLYFGPTTSGAIR